MSRRIDLIEPGFYRTQLAAKAIYVSVKFWMVGDEIRAMVDGSTCWPDGTPVDPWDIWPDCEGPITEAEFEFMERRRRWAIEHQPSHPAANAFRAVDLAKIPPRRPPWL